MTIVVGSSKTVNVFDWNKSSAFWEKVYEFNSTNGNIASIGLHREGRFLSYLEGNCLRILHRESISPFQEIKKNWSSVKYASISDDGNNLVISHENNSVTYFILESNSYVKTFQFKSSGKIIGAQVANAKVFALLMLNDVGKSESIQIYRKNEASDKNRFHNISIQEDSIDPKNPLLSLSNDGSQICVQFVNRTVGTFNWDGKKWQRSGQLIGGSWFTVSGDFSTLFIVNNRSREKLQTYRNSRIR